MELSPATSKLVNEIEMALCSIYNFNPKASVQDFFLTEDELIDTLGDQAKLHPYFQAQAALWIIDNKNQNEEFFLGLHLKNDVHDLLSVHNPLVDLNMQSLQLFWLLVEEISHFHLVLNRAQAKRGVSQLELECQGEVDKYLLAYLLLQSHGQLTIHDMLMKLLFSKSIIYLHFDHNLYQKASYYAKNFIESTLYPMIKKHYRQHSNSRSTLFPCGTRDLGGSKKNPS